MSRISNKLNVRKCCADAILNDPYWIKFATIYKEDTTRKNNDCQKGACQKNKPIDKNVNHPDHYRASNGMEAIDVIEAFGLDKDFCLGNCAKYLLRLGKKDNILQDAKKCRWYIDRFIQNLE